MCVSYLSELMYYPWGQTVTTVMGIGVGWGDYLHLLLVHSEYE